MRALRCRVGDSVEIPRGTRAGPVVRRPSFRPTFPERRIVFVDDFRRHSGYEVCLGVAEYVAERPLWGFDPWPVSFDVRTLPTRLDLRQVSGIVTLEPAKQPSPRFYECLAGPMVYYLPDAAHPEADGMGVDDAAVGAMAAEHLWSRGYRHFVFVGSASFGWSRERGAGFAAALAARGHRPSECLYPEEELPVSWSWNIHQRRQVLAEVIGRLPRPCGVFAANDVIAWFVFSALGMRGGAAPPGVGLIGVDDDPFANAASGFAITTIELPFHEVGRQAARLLEEQWQGRPPGRVVRLPPVRVVLRASTSAFVTADPLVRAAQACIESRRRRWVTVGEITRSVGSNRVTLGKRFQRELKMTLHDYLRWRFIDYAAERLRQGDVSIKQLQAECGFSSASYFCQLFKEVTGRLPGKARLGRRE